MLNITCAAAVIQLLSRLGLFTRLHCGTVIITFIRWRAPLRK